MINKYFSPKKTNGNTIENEDGKLLFEDSDISKRWKNYIENLYDETDELLDLAEQDDDKNGNEITREEFQVALKLLKDKKSCGLDEIPAELLKALDEEMKKVLFAIIEEIYESGVILNDFQKVEWS